MPCRAGGATTRKISATFSSLTSAAPLYTTVRCSCLHETRFTPRKFSFISCEKWHAHGLTRQEQFSSLHDSQRHDESVPSGRNLVKRPLPPQLIDNLIERLSHPVPRAVVARHLAKLLFYANSANYVLDQGSAQALASAFAKSSFPEGARHVLSFAHRLGTRLQQFCYENVVYELSLARAWKQIPSLVTLAQRQSLRTTRRLLNWRIRSMIESQHFGFLDQVLDHFKKNRIAPNRKTYHMLVEGHILNHNVRQARESLDWMMNAGFPINAETHVAVLSVYRKTLGPDPAVERVAFTAFRGLDGYPDCQILNGLIQSRIAADDVEGVFRFLSMFNLSSSAQDIQSIANMQISHSFGDPVSQSSLAPRPNLDTFRALMNFFLKRKEYERSEAIFTSLVKAGLHPDAAIATYLIQAVGEKSLSRAIGILCILCSEKPKLVAKLERLARRRISVSSIAWASLRDLRLDIQSFNAFIRVWLPIKGFTNLDHLLYILQQFGLPPNEQTIGILSAYLSRYQGIRTRDLILALNRLIRLGRTYFTVSDFNNILYSSIQHQINILKGSGHQDSRGNIASFMFHRLRPNGELDHPPDDAKSLRIGIRKLLIPLMRALNRRRLRTNAATLALHMKYNAVVRLDLRAAESALDVLRLRGMRPRMYHYAALAEGYAASGDMRSAHRALERAASVGVQPGVVMFTILIVGYARLRQPHMAQAVFDSMLRVGITPDWASIDAVVGAWHRAGVSRNARDTLLSSWSYVAPMPPHLQDAELPVLVEEFRHLRTSHLGLVNPGETGLHTPEHQRRTRKKWMSVIRVWKSTGTT